MFMAKPMPVASIDDPTSSNTHTKDLQDPPRNPRCRRRRNPPARKPRLFSPSTGLLSLLATIASSSPAAGSPAPPSFLCPSIEQESKVSRRKERRRPRLTIDNLARRQASASSQARPLLRTIPDRFERQENGSFVKVESYTLYGVCPSCATPASSALDDQISHNTTGVVNYDANYIPDKLPPGWKPPSASNTARTTLILAISLVLAFLICSLIIGCLMWRKNVRRRYKKRSDVEMKGRGRRRRSDSSIEEEREREVSTERHFKLKERLWAKATARWKANARYIGRQRRAKRPAPTRSRAHDSTTSLNNPGEPLTTSLSSSSPSSPAQSRATSRRPSSTLLRAGDFITGHQPLVTDNHPISVPSIQLSPPVDEPTNLSPPAYQQKPDTSASSLSSFSRRHSWASFAPSTSDTSIPSAHVATDDKAVLARLAEMASAPPVEDSAASSLPSTEVSAPEWRDEELEDILAQTDPLNQTNGHPTNSPFPAPPSKMELMAPNFYDYPYSFEELSPPEAELGPSAPPFEATSSHSLANGDGTLLLPSAPTLDDFYVSDASPSAPDISQLRSAQLTGDDGVTVSMDGLPPQSNGHDGILPVYRP